MEKNKSKKTAGHKRSADLSAALFKQNAEKAMVAEGQRAERKGQKKQLTLAESAIRAGSATMDAAIADFLHGHGLPLNLSNCARMKALIDTARFTSEAYKPPPPERVGGDLLDINWFNHCKSYLLNSSQVVLPPLVRDFYGAAVVSDGATIRRVPLINILLASPFGMMLIELVDCAAYSGDGGKKDALFIAREILKLVRVRQDTVGSWAGRI